MTIVWCCLLVLLLHYTTGQPGPTEFWLYTALGERQALDPSQNVPSVDNFDPCNVTIVLVTGFGEPRSNPELVRSANMISRRFYNVILVDYDTFRYLWSVFYGGRDVARLVEWLVNTRGAVRSQIILVGLSMGAHTIAYASNLYRVSRIIALDPAGPLYDIFPEMFRLDKSDADLVEVIYSSSIFDTTSADNLLDIFGVGSFHNDIGHVNYMVNDGISQPGCEGDFYCSHLVSAYLFMASISSCKFEFRPCFSYWAFDLGWCDSNPTLTLDLGADPYTVPRDSKMYFYRTSREEFPYCSEDDEAEGPVTLNPTFC